jgi:transposase
MPARRDASPERHLRSQTYAAELAAEQAAVFDLFRAGTTWFFNQAIASQLDRYRHHVPVETYAGLSYAVSVARKAAVEFRYRGPMRLISDVPAVMLHGALRQLSASWTRHLKMRQEGRKSSPPGFRSVHRGGCLYWQVQDGAGPCPLGKVLKVTRPGTGDRPAMATLRVPGKIGLVAVRYHRELPADTLVRFASVRVDGAGRYWVTVQYETTQVRQAAAGGVVGIDRGVAVTIATSDGDTYDPPCLSSGQQERKDRLQRAMARKRRLNPCKHDEWVTVRGRARLVSHFCPPLGDPGHDCECWKHSGRYVRNKLAYLKLSQRAARQRTSGAHLASRALADRYAVVVVEDLDVSAMTASAKGTEEAPGRNVRAKSGLNREILARGWYQVQQLASYKTQVVTVPARHTSQECPRCGHVDPANRPERALFRCTACGLTGHADVVASINVRGRYRSRPAAAQAVAARECLGESQQPANSQQYQTAAAEPGHQGGDVAPGQHSHPGQDPDLILWPAGKLIPQAWGQAGPRKAPHRRRPGRVRLRSPSKAV